MRGCILALLFSATHAATVYLDILNSTESLITRVESKPDSGAGYEMEVNLLDGIDYISIYATGFDTQCTWSYQETSIKTPIKIAYWLDFCDYPIRKATKKAITMVMPIAGIPEFDKKGAKLKLQCIMGSVALSKVVYDCEKQADTDEHKKRNYFFDDPVIVVPPPDPVPQKKEEKPLISADSTAVLITSWTMSLANLAIAGASPCFTAFTDLFDLFFYVGSKVHGFAAETVPEGFLISSTLGNVFTDGSFCVQSLKAGKFWDTEKNFWYSLANGGFSFSWNELPDDLYFITFFLQM